MSPSTLVSTRNRWVLWMGLFLVPSFCLLSSCLGEPQSQNAVNAAAPESPGVTGALQGSNYPYDSIGVVRHPSDEIHAPCTATLIGLNLVVTVASCVSDDSVGKAVFLAGGITDISQGKRNESMATVSRIHRQSDFWANADLGSLTVVKTGSSSSSSTNPTTATTATVAAPIHDLYAILELDSPLGALHGIFLTPSEEQMEPIQRQIQVEMDAAVPAGGFVSIDCTCRYTPNATTVTHNCDLNDFTNASLALGGPMFTRIQNQPAYILSIFTPTRNLQSDPRYFEGVVSTMIHLHLLKLQNPSISSSTSGSSINSISVLPPRNQASSSDSINSSSNHSENTMTRHPHQSSSTADKISNQQPKRIQASIAYTCLGVMTIAWIAIILFVAVRQWRRA